MTKKDFELISRVVNQFGGDAGRKAVLALEFSRELRVLNPKFDTERFLKACNIRSK